MKLKKDMEFALKCSKGYFKGAFCNPQKARILDKLLDKKELTIKEKEWIVKSSEVTAFEQAMLYTLNNIVFVINHAEED